MKMVLNQLVSLSFQLFLGLAGVKRQGSATTTWTYNHSKEVSHVFLNKFLSGIFKDF